MNTITIKKCSITELDADAIVNAANERLWAGSGVCGAIFAAAGYEQLEAACAAVGPCPTGSAVITPGFRLKARYIIHAVGPVWAGGGCGEAERLYGAYRSALALAAAHCCASVGFPLISAGIFGYPAAEAWAVALRACRDFLAEGHRIDIIFAVLSDRILALGQEALSALETGG